MSCTSHLSTRPWCLQCTLQSSKDQQRMPHRSQLHCAGLLTVQQRLCRQPKRWSVFIVLPWAADAVHRFVLAQPTHPKSHSYFAPGDVSEKCLSRFLALDPSTGQSAHWIEKLSNEDPTRCGSVPHFLMPIFSSYLRFSDCRYRIMRMAQGTTTVTMLAHQPGVDTSKAVVIEVCSSSASGTAARAVLRRELVDTGRPPNTKDWAHKVTKANARRRVGSSTSLEAIGPTRAEQFQCCSYSRAN